MYKSIVSNSNLMRLLLMVFYVCGSCSCSRRRLVEPWGCFYTKGIYSDGMSCLSVMFWLFMLNLWLIRWFL